MSDTPKNAQPVGQSVPTLDELGNDLKNLISTQNVYSTQFEKAILGFLLILVAEKQRQAKQVTKGSMK